VFSQIIVEWMSCSSGNWEIIGLLWHRVEAIQASSNYLDGSLGRKPQRWYVNPKSSNVCFPSSNSSEQLLLAEIPRLVLWPVSITCTSVVYCTALVSYPGCSCTKSFGSSGEKWWWYSGFLLRALLCQRAPLKMI